MATSPQPPDWATQPSPAARLAAWTTLSLDRFSDAYKGHSPRDTAKAWAVIEQEVGATRPADPRHATILAACKEAEARGFLGRLALYVAGIESDSRSPTDVGDLIVAFDPGGELHAIVQGSGGLFDGAAIVTASKTYAASAYVWDGRQVIGTACLVRPHLVLTAAHVVMQRDAAGTGWSNDLQPGLSFWFKRAANDPTPGGLQVPALGGQPVSHSPPHQQPPVPIIPAIRQQAAACLDFALVRLAQQVEHITPIDIDALDDPKQDDMGLVLGFAGGTALKWGAGQIVDADLVSCRMLHRAGAIAGMSGGICVGSDGSLIGIHEGAVNRLGVDHQPLRDPATQKNLLDNRAVCLKAIRAMQRVGGADPLRSAPGVPGIGFEDPALGQELFMAGLRLAGPGGKAAWMVTLDTLLAAAPAGDRPMPVFHPWFARDLEKWYDAASNPLTRLCFVTGAPGTGKSFCARILRGKMANPNRDLTVLRPTQANNWAWNDAVSSLTEAAQVVGRTRQAAIAYDDIPLLVAELGLVGGVQRTVSEPRFIVMDFENAAAFRVDDGPWRNFIAALLAEDWARLVLVGLPIEICDDIEILARTSAASRLVEVRYFALAHLTDEEFTDYVMKLGLARGRSMTNREARNMIAGMRALVANLWTPEAVGAEAVAATATVRAAVVAAAIDKLLRSMPEAG